MAETSGQNEEHGGEITPIVPGPGARLKEAREAKKLSVKEVTSALYLRDGIVDAIESDDYEVLPAPIFVKGYLRNYARLLGISEEPVLAQYQAQRPAEPAKLVPTNSKGSGQKPNYMWMLVPAIAAIIVILMALLAFDEDEASSENNPAESPVVVLGSAKNQIPDIQVLDNLAEVIQDAVIVEAGIDNVEQVPQAAPVEVLAEAEMVLQYQQQGDDETSEAVLAPNGTLELVVDKECWTDIRDHKGQRLVFGLLPSGTKRTVSGQLPYTVLFGNAIAVTLRFNNKPYDFSSHVRGNVARFTLGR